MERLDKLNIDLGNVDLGSKHDFTITNTSGIRIEKVIPSCGCTSAIMGSNGKDQKISLAISITKEFPYSVPDNVNELKQKKKVDIRFTDGFTHTFDINYTIGRNG